MLWFHLNNNQHPEGLVRLLPLKFCGSDDVERILGLLRDTFNIAAIAIALIQILLYEQNYHAAQEEERRKR
jgi:hypothetical protein